MATQAPQSQIIDFYDTHGGIDTISSSVSLGQSKLRDAQNVNYFPIGGIQWRNGYVKLNTSAVGGSATCNGVYMARYSGGTNQAMLVCGGKLFSMTSLNGTWNDITNGVSIASSASFPVNFAILNDIVCMSNGNNTSWQTNSSGTTQVVQGSPAFTSALFNVEYHGYMFWGQTNESGVQYNRLRFSDVYNPNSFTMLGVNNYMDVSPGDGGDLRGAVAYGPYLYAFKRNNIYQILFQPTQVNSAGVTFPFTQNAIPIVCGVGTQSHRSIVKFTTPITNTVQSGEELVFFVDQFGMPRIFDGQTSVQVGYSISQSRDTTIPSLSNMDRTMLPYVWAVNYPDRNQILCFVSSSSSQFDTCWVLDYTKGFVWGRMKFANTFASGALFERNDGTWRPYFGDYAGIVRQYDTGTNDDGTAISSYAIWGDAFFQKPAIRSKWPWIEVKGTTSGVVKIDVYPDGSDVASSSLSTNATLSGTQTTWGTTGSGGTMTWGTSLWAKAGLTTTQKELGIDAKTLRVKLSNSTLNNTATIEGFALEVVPQGISQV